jgi:putative endonuclease
MADSGAPGGAEAAGRRRRAGERGESLAAAHLTGQGWQVVGRRVRVGRDELDILAVDPGPPAILVAVEVRLRSSSLYGVPEESVDRRKVSRLYRAMSTLTAVGVLAGGEPLPRLPWRVDLIAIDDGPRIGPGAGGPVIRHLRSLEPG